MSIEQTTLNMLSSKRAGGIMLIEILDYLISVGIKRISAQKSLSRLEKKKYITFQGSHITMTKDGERYIKRRNARLQTFNSPFDKSSPKNLLVLFDIPHDRKAEREWFRWHLKKFNYKMIQKSVWLGPSPLPKEFDEYLKKIKLENCIKTFKVSRIKK